MSGDNQAAEEETNFYLITLRECRDTLIPSARDAVYSGTGDPGSSIASAINGGGWECDKATEWVSELLEHTRKVMPAFDDAISDVNAAMSREPEKVPKGDPHGLAWNRTWHNIQRANAY
jgi:hypothetical protein